MKTIRVTRIVINHELQKCTPRLSLILSVTQAFALHYVRCYFIVAA
jgi:hypothetical protein